MTGPIPETPPSQISPPPSSPELSPPPPLTEISSPVTHSELASPSQPEAPNNIFQEALKALGDRASAIKKAIEYELFIPKLSSDAQTALKKIAEEIQTTNIIQAAEQLKNEGITDASQVKGLTEALEVPDTASVITKGVESVPDGLLMTGNGTEAMRHIGESPLDITAHKALRDADGLSSSLGK